jgi:phosphatidylglycerol:prolipoprotein diacylglycerol transferase
MNWIYPAIMGVAVTTGVVVSRRTQRPLGLSAGQRFAIGLAAFCGGMLGAKLPFVLLDWEGFLSGTAWFESGKTLVLGLVGGYFGVVAIKWALGIEVKTGDSFAAPVAAAIAVGRLACFVGGCCFGTPTQLPWGVDFGDGIRRHPTQLYEFAFHAICAVILTALQR